LDDVLLKKAFTYIMKPKACVAWFEIGMSLRSKVCSISKPWGLVKSRVYKPYEVELTHEIVVLCHGNLVRW